MTESTPRFTVDADKIAVLDTETNLYAGYLFVESATEVAGFLNNGTWSIDEVTWEANPPTPTPELLEDLRQTSREFAEILGVKVPYYAK
jgi:hypothetical protein